MLTSILCCRMAVGIARRFRRVRSKTKLARTLMGRGRGVWDTRWAPSDTVDATICHGESHIVVFVLWRMDGRHKMMDLFRVVDASSCQAPQALAIFIT